MKEQKNKMQSKLRYSVLLLLVIMVVLWVLNYNRPIQYQKCSGIVWTTQYNITYQSDKRFDDSIQIIFKNVDNSLSMYNKKSLISRINIGEDVLVDSMIKYLYELSQKNTINLKFATCWQNPAISSMSQTNSKTKSLQ